MIELVRRLQEDRDPGLPELARSALFEKISGAYLYATLVSALPLYVGAVERSALFSSLARRFPGRSGSMLVAMALFAVFVLVLTGVAIIDLEYGSHDVIKFSSNA